VDCHTVKRRTEEEEEQEEKGRRGTSQFFHLERGAEDLPGGAGEEGGRI